MSLQTLNNKAKVKQITSMFELERAKSSDLQRLVCHCELTTWRASHPTFKGKYILEVKAKVKQLTTTLELE